MTARTFPDHVEVEELAPGDVVDLEGDPYGDPAFDDELAEDDPARDLATFEYAEVADAPVRETDACTVVEFSLCGGGHVVGFPRGHVVVVVEHRVAS